MSATITELTPTDARIAADINRQSDQAVQQIRADRQRMLAALRTGATDVPLVPVPFLERCTSPLWAILKPHAPKAYNRKLTDDDAEEIRRRHKEGDTSTALGVMYGVARQSIDQIVAGKTYRPVTTDMSHEHARILDIVREATR